MSAPQTNNNDDEMLEEYSTLLDKQTPRPNRFASEAASAKRFVTMPDGTRQEVRTIRLDEDVAEFFPTSESINEVLRAIVHSLPQHSQPDYTHS